MNFEPKIISIMALTSIHFKPCKVNFSQAHNLREVELSYVNKELSHLNTSHYAKGDDPSIRDLALRERQCRELYQEKVGQKAQAKSVFLREGVIVLDSNVTDQDIGKLMRAIAQLTGWTPLQLHVHRDEGHYKYLTAEQREQTEFLQNLHAHVIFDCQDKKTGKVIRVEKEQLSAIQDLTAKYLHMERGVKSGKKHIDATQYRAMKLQEEINLKESEKQALINEIEELQEIKGKYEGLNEKHSMEIITLLYDFFKQMKKLGINMTENEKSQKNGIKIIEKYLSEYSKADKLTYAQAVEFKREAKNIMQGKEQSHEKSQAQSKGL
jgi:hypothetical protein